MTRLPQLLRQFKGRRIAVLGDFVADVFIYGEISRISREAPVLILNQRDTQLVPGGGANAVHNLRALGAEPLPIGIVGNDAGWGNIRVIQQQMLGEERAIATSLSPTRYDKIVEAFGGYGEKMDNPADIRPALERAFASGKPACINVALDPKGLAKTAPNMAYIM